MTNETHIWYAMLCTESALDLFEQWIGSTEPRAILNKVKAYLTSQDAIDETICDRASEAALNAHVLANSYRFVSSFRYPLFEPMEAFIKNVADIAVAVNFIVRCVVGRISVEKGVRGAMECVHRVNLQNKIDFYNMAEMAVKQGESKCYVSENYTELR